MTRKPDLQSPESILARIRNQKRPGQTTRNAQAGSPWNGSWPGSPRAAIESNSSSKAASSSI